jgi:hypothetical protein
MPRAASAARPVAIPEPAPLRAQAAHQGPSGSTSPSVAGRRSRPRLSRAIAAARAYEFAPCRGKSVGIEHLLITRAFSRLASFKTAAPTGLVFPLVRQTVNCLDLCRRPCVDGEDSAGYALGFCSKKELDCVRYVLDLRETAQRTSSRDLLSAVGS